MVKCGHCNNEVKQEDAIYNTKTKRYYHEKCYQDLLDRKALCEYICEVWKYKKPSPKMYQQMTNYYERGISYKDMLLTLKYFYEVEKGDVKKSQDGIGIIPYVLERAKEYSTLEKLEQERLIKKFEEEQNKKSIKQIHVKEEERKNKKLINIDNL